jgi:DNA helicase HerA-like ATPase
LILGASGSGKTETLKVIASEIHNFGIPCLIFDFHGDVTLEGATEYILSHGPACTHGMNPLELDSTDPIDGGVYAQVNILLNMLKACIPSLGHRQWRVIKETLNEAYNSSGITDDPNTWQLTPPTFGNVLGILDERLEDEELSRSQKNIIESAYDAVSRVFEHPVFAKKEQISVENLLATSHRLNLAHLEEDVRFIITDTLLRKLARALKLKGSIPVQPENDFERFRLFVFVDEAKILSMGGKDRDSSSAVLNTLATEYRKFGLGIVLASQMSDHFSSETKAQMATRLVLKPFDFSEARKNAQDVNLTADDLMKLTGKGDGYLRMGTNSAPVRIQVVPLLDR